MNCCALKLIASYYYTRHIREQVSTDEEGWWDASFHSQQTDLQQSTTYST